MSGGKDQGVLGRWSQRKAKAREGRPEADPGEGTDVAPVTSGASVNEPEDAPLDPEAEAEALRKLGLPDPDQLQEGDDFTGFLRKEVPARLRRRALARLWRSHPLLATVDDLVEYGEDYTDAATVVENMRTVYQVGRGMMMPDRVPDTSIPGLRGEPALDELEDSTLPDSVEAGEPDASTELIEGAEAESAEEITDGDGSPPVVVERSRRRSMTFRFEGDAPGSQTEPNPGDNRRDSEGS